MAEAKTGEAVKAGRRPRPDLVWSHAVAERVLEVVAETGSPKLASQEVGVHVSTIHYHRKADPDFGVRYAEAMDTAFHGVLGRAFERATDEVQPSDRLLEVLLKFRWPDRLNGLIASLEGAPSGDGPVGLDPRVIARMDPADRTALVELLERYVDAEEALRARPALA